MKTESEIRAELRAWIVRTNGKVRPEDVADDTPILERRIVRSADLLDLILLVEELRGRSLDVQSLAPGSFRSIDAIWTCMFAAPADDGARPA